MDFIQQDFYVNEKKYQIYQFSMTGIDEKNIEIELPVEENATEFEYLIVQSPDMTRFENEQGLNWDKLIDSKNAYSFFAVLDETANEMKQDAAYQVFLFELHGDLQRRVHSSFRMDLKGKK